MESPVKRSSLLVLLLFSLLPNPAVFGAQGQISHHLHSGAAEQQTAAAPAHQQQAKLVNRILANGLEVIVLEDHSIPLVTCELAVRNGSFTEPPELNGLSHLFEHMFFKANRASVTGESYLNTIDQLGIIYNGQTQEELVNYYFTTTSPNLAIAMRFMRDAVRYPLFGDWPRREKDPFVEFPLVEHPPLPKSEGSIIKQPVQNVIVEIGWQGPSI